MRARPASKSTSHHGSASASLIRHPGSGDEREEVCDQGWADSTSAPMSSGASTRRSVCGARRVLESR